MTKNKKVVIPSRPYLAQRLVFPPTPYPRKVYFQTEWRSSVSPHYLAAALKSYSFTKHFRILMRIDTFDKLIEAVKLAIRGLSSDKDLQKKMSVYGFTPQSLQQGIKLLNVVELTGDTREQKSREARHLTHQITQERQTTQAVFRNHVAIARAAFREEPLVQQDLKIDKMATGNWGWAKQALDFYKLAPIQMARLQQFGATPEAFQQNQAAVQALLDLRAERQQRKGKTQDFTQERNRKIKELRDWYGEFRRLARIALKENPQLLETFGIVVPSGPRKRKTATE